MSGSMHLLTLSLEPADHDFCTKAVAMGMINLWSGCRGTRLHGRNQTPHL